MSATRTIEERAAAVQAYLVDTKAVYNDAALIKGAIQREFADVVESDPRVVALVEAARIALGCVQHGGSGSGAKNLESLLRAALKSFEKA